MTTPAAISEWVRLRSKQLSTILPTPRTRIPWAATYSNVLRSVDAGQINEMVYPSAETSESNAAL